MSNLRYSVSERSLIFEAPDSGSRTVDFDCPIAETVAVGALILVRLDPAPDDALNENVFAVDSSGEIVWRVPPVPHVYEDSPYTSLKVAGDEVYLSNWDGLNLTVELQSGKILAQEYGK